MKDKFYWTHKRRDHEPVKRRAVSRDYLVTKKLLKPYSKARRVMFIQILFSSFWYSYLKKLKLISRLKILYL